VLEALLTLGLMGLVVGVGLSLASKIFYVYVDPLIVAVDSVLPGANCGGCGFPGCSANAEAIVQGKSAPNSCVAGGDELTQQIAALLGMTVTAKEPDIAKPGCYYSVKDADTKYSYLGINDCRAAALLSGGMKVCSVGCLGLGTCVKVCPFGALKMGADGLPVVDSKKCTGCGTCERECPKHIIKLSSVTRRILREYTVDDCTTPCQRACPAGIDIRRYVGAIANGDFEGAVQIIKERNPFPAVIGRICPHPCEHECRRNLVDEGVAINPLKRFCADFEISANKRNQPYKAPATGRKIAVIGGGIQGLSTAFFLARLGHSPVVYEATGKLGGLLRTAIAENRLPREVLDWEIEGIREMGVEMSVNSPLGSQVTVAGLLAQGHESVFLAAGGWDNRLERLGSADPEPAQLGLHLLIDVLKKGAGKLPGPVVFAGGSNAALEAALGVNSGNAVVVLRTGADSLDDNLLKSARKKGVEVLFNAAVCALGGEDDTLKQVEIADLASNEKQSLPAGSLIVAAGRTPELIARRAPLPEAAQGEAKKEQDDSGPIVWEALPAYKKPMSAGGLGLASPADAIADFSAAVEAIGAGRRAAASVHILLNSGSLIVEGEILTPTVYVQDVHTVRDVTPAPREIAPQAPSQAKPVEEAGFSKEQAIVEASRCLQCGLVCYQHTALGSQPLKESA
jgi:NADPH-dependent glutamate synthase beta subunit-like oxidoreductase